VSPASARSEHQIKIEAVLFCCAGSAIEEHATTQRYITLFSRKNMKRLVLTLLPLCVLCGCAQTYKITLRNHQELTTSSRPKFDKATETYRFKDASGNQVVLPAFRVKEIAPL
jgi:hypothetical protein